MDMRKTIETEVEVPEDDTIIGKAFRLSLIAFVVIGAAVTAGVYLLGGDDELGEVRESKVEAPRAVERSVAVPTVRFTAITSEAGVDFERTNGADGHKYLPETMGGGVAFLDFDVDGDADLLFVNGTSWSDPASGPPQALFENDGSGSFRNVTSAAGLDFAFQGQGVAVGDWDADGDPDLYLSGVNEHRLLRNDAGVFVDVTDAMGLAGHADGWGSSSAFFDADGDGDLDLFVCHYVRWSKDIDKEIDYQLTGLGRAYGPPTNYEGADSRLYRNEGEGTGRRFVDVSAESGIRVANEASGVPVGKGLGVSPYDVDGDGDIDLMVANDTVRNFLFVSDGKGKFEERGITLGIAYGRGGQATGAMGIDAAEYRRDGSLAFAVGNFANEMSSLYASRQGRVYFTDESIVEGIGAPSRKFLSFGIFFFDYDLDGREDLLQVNGHLEDEITTVQPSQTFEQPPQLFWNAGPDARAAFVEVAASDAGDLLARHIVGRGAAYADIDGDGDLDVVLTQSRGAPVLLRNDLDAGRHWLHVRLKDGGPNRAGIGARVELVADGVRQVRTIMPTRGYISQVEPTAFFGLGDATRVESLSVRWPDGATMDVPVPDVDRVLVVER
jgi:hypothetical protein